MITLTTSTPFPYRRGQIVTALQRRYRVIAVAGCTGTLQPAPTLRDLLMAMAA